MIRPDFTRTTDLKSHPFWYRKIRGFSAVILLLLLAMFITPLAQAATSDGSGVTIAVIDYSGIDSASPELAGVIVHEVCLDAMAQSGASNYGAHCPNNQSIDEDPGSAATSFTASGDQQFSGGGHGTAVASVIAGVTVGIAKGVKIVAIREEHLLSPALEWVHANAKKYNISAIVMSEAWGISADSRSFLPCSQSRETKPNGEDNALTPYFDTLKADGLAIFVSAGNEGFTSLIDSPSCIPSVFGVGATDGNSVAGYSNISPDVSILAPGTNMVSTTVAKNSFTIASQQGTSFSNPYAGAVYAKVKAMYPNLTADQILAAMRTTGTLVDDSKVKHIPLINQENLFAFLDSGKAIPDLSSTFIQQKSSFSIGSTDSLTTQNAFLQEQIKKMQSQIDALTASSKDLNDQLSASKANQGDVTQLQSQISDLRAANAALANQLAVATKKLDGATIKVLVCIKGSSMKKVTALRPNCPSGWKVKP